MEYFRIELRILQTFPVADFGPPELKNTPKIWMLGIIRYISLSIKVSGRCVHTILHTISFIAREKAGPYAFSDKANKTRKSSSFGSRISLKKFIKNQTIE